MGAGNPRLGATSSSRASLKAKLDLLADATVLLHVARSMGETALAEATKERNEAADAYAKARLEADVELLAELKAELAEDEDA